jgi:hypothetical protein
MWLKVVFREYGNEPSGFMKPENNLTNWVTLNFLKEDSVP